jgi:tripartite-type tricarboxylate transporter receptor subunit TctC
MKYVSAISIGLAAMAMVAVDVASADDKPAIEVITHAGAGGGTDVNSRMMMIRTRRALKQDMVVVNKRGGGGAASMNYFKSRPADGNSILTFTVGHAISMAMGKT